jgi:hypothetical protein
MTTMMKATAAALAIAGATVTAGCATHSHDRYGHSDRYRHNDTARASVEFGGIEYGYSDGYWDNRHQWHQWSSDSDRDNYRRHRNSHYYDWKHDRDGNDGWRGN